MVLDIGQKMNQLPFTVSVCLLRLIFCGDKADSFVSITAAHQGASHAVGRGKCQFLGEVFMRSIGEFSFHLVGDIRLQVMREIYIMRFSTNRH